MRILPVLAAALVAIVVSLGGATVAHAVPPRGGGGGTSGSPRAEGAAWRPLFEQGHSAYEAGRYEDAAESFYRAREAGGPPSLLYNQALCLDRLERFEAARSVYQAYLAASPAAANRAEVEARIAELEPTADIESGGSGLATRIAPPSGPVMQIMPLEGGFEAVVVGEGRAVVRRDDGPRVEEMGPEWVVSWFLLAGTLGSLGATIGVGVEGQATFDALRTFCADNGGCTDDEIASSSAHVSETVTNVLLVTTGVLAAATVISFLAEGASTGGTRVYVDLGPGRLALRGTF